MLFHGAGYVARWLPMSRRPAGGHVRTGTARACPVMDVVGQDRGARTAGRSHTRALGCASVRGHARRTMGCSRARRDMRRVVQAKNEHRSGQAGKHGRPDQDRATLAAMPHVKGLPRDRSGPRGFIHDRSSPRRLRGLSVNRLRRGRLDRDRFNVVRKWPRSTRDLDHLMQRLRLLTPERVGAHGDPGLLQRRSHAADRSNPGHLGGVAQ